MLSVSADSSTLLFKHAHVMSVTFFSMVTSVVLFQGFKATVAQIITVVMGFLVICCGITILQMSKIDPSELGKKLDRRSTLLLQAARSNTEHMDEKDLTGVEDPGIDSIRGSFGPLGSMIRARSARRLSMSSSNRGTSSLRHQLRADPEAHYGGLTRHQLYDAPVPSINTEGSGFFAPGSPASGTSLPPRQSTIKFGTEDVVHKYPTKGPGTELATHERRDVSYRSPSPNNISLKSMSAISEESTANQSSTRTNLSGAPSMTVDTYGPLRTAPATFFTSNSQRSGPFHDPFEAPPATSVGSTFSRSMGGAATQPLPSRDSFSPVSDDEGRKAWKARSAHKRISSDRRYPRGADDREESESLVRSPSPEESSGDRSEEDVSQSPSIRLVGPSPGRF